MMTRAHTQILQRGKPCAHHTLLLPCHYVELCRTLALCALCACGRHTRFLAGTEFLPLDPLFSLAMSRRQEMFVC